MKKIIALILALTIVMSFAACGSKTDVENLETDNVIENVVDKVEDEVVPEKNEETDAPVKEEKPEVKPQEKPAETPVEKPAEKPVEKPVEKPEEKPVASTMGQTLLADFKARANKGTVLEIAEGLLTNSVIQFMGGAMPVEEGYLAGFDNEITGFKSGATFAPMIGSIAFVGYVFELENEADVAGFISNLQKNANKRWNICVEADEMVTGSVGNKVFFVMCPKATEE